MENAKKVETQEAKSTNTTNDFVNKILDKVEVKGFAALGTVDDMRRKLDEYTGKRDLIVSFIRDNFEKGKDYGIADSRNDKDVLLKPGAEKLCRMFDTHAEWEIDKETALALGDRKGTICMICRIVDNTTGAVIGEGRGAETIGNKQRDSNKTIKNAEKCSLVDAALYTFMLSEFFTQDDGGKAKVDLKTQGQMLLNKITEMRTNCDSDMSNNVFLINANLKELKKKTITTQGEMDHMWKVLIEKNAYDWATCERIPDSV